MDKTTFDTISRSVATSQTRRSALRGLVAGAATLVAGGVLLQGEDASAKRRKRRKGKGKGKLLQPGERCQNDNQCTSGYICEVPVNGGNSDEYCSGGQGRSVAPRMVMGTIPSPSARWASPAPRTATATPASRRSRPYHLLSLRSFSGRRIRAARCMTASLRKTEKSTRTSCTRRMQFECSRSARCGRTAWERCS
jgi:hypothetical protein